MKTRIHSLNPTKRFSERVANYVKYRPSYPPEVFDFFENDLHLSSGQVVADIGSGTGIFTKLLLHRGFKVYAVEPNKEMREAADHEFDGHPYFNSVSAPAEATTLANNSVDFITAATAFHWFDLEKSRREFRRILKPNGLVILLWNVRSDVTDVFHQDYESLIQKFGTDYQQIKDNDEDLESMFRSFFADGKYIHKQFKNHQDFDFEGLCGRLLSSSYVPQMGHPHFEAMLNELRQIFERHAKSNYVRIRYDTEVYVGNV